MKKFSFVAVVAVLMILTGSARATTLQELGLNEPSDINLQEPADVMSKIPGLNQGVGFSLVDSGFNYLTTLDIVQYKGFGLEIGYAGRQKNSGDKLIGVISYDLFNAKNAGITVPVLDLIDVRVGGYVGFGRIQIGSEKVRDGGNEFDAGLSLTALKIKW